MKRTLLRTNPAADQAAALHTLYRSMQHLASSSTTIKPKSHEPVSPLRLSILRRSPVRRRPVHGLLVRISSLVVSPCAGIVAHGVDRVLEDAISHHRWMPFLP